jgi:hypothetical protein
MDEYMDLTMNLLEAIKEDENLVPMLTEGIDKIFATIIEEEDIYMYNIIGQTMNYNEPVLEWESSFEDELNDMKEDMIEEIEDGYEEAIYEMEETFEDDDYIKMMDAMKDVYSEVELESQIILDDGYIKGTESFVTIDDSIVDAINDSPILSEMLGYELDGFNEMDILFKVKMYRRTGVMQIDETIEFEGLPSSAQDFSELEEEELYDIIASSLFSIFKLFNVHSPNLKP